MRTEAMRRVGCRDPSRCEGWLQPVSDGGDTHNCEAAGEGFVHLSSLADRRSVTPSSTGSHAIAVENLLKCLPSSTAAFIVCAWHRKGKAMPCINSSHVGVSPYVPLWPISGRKASEGSSNASESPNARENLVHLVQQSL